MATDQRRVVVVSEGRGRAFGADELPLHVGTRESDEIRVPGRLEESLASIGMLGDQPFVQSARPQQVLLLNDSPVSGSRQLEDGDILSAADGRIRCRLFPHEVRLEVGPAALADELAAAPAASPAPAADADFITPTPFTPSSQQDAPGNGRRFGPLAAATALFGLLLVLVLGFLLTSVPVGFAIDPLPDSVRLPSTWASFHLQDRYLLRPGVHEIEIEKEGYHLLKEDFEVSADPDQEFRFELTKLPGIVEVLASEEGAVVSIDGIERGTTPLLDLEVEEGTHALLVKAPRHLPADLSIEIEGAGVRQRFELALTPAWAPISLATMPPGAVVVVDGEELGTTPGTFGLDAGPRSLSLQLPGYKNFSTELLVEADQPQSIDDIVLDEADGVLRITTDPPGAQVVVGSSSPGRTPIDLYLEPDEQHKLSLFKPGYAMARRSVSLEPGEERALRVALAPQLGRVYLRITPADATLSVDGKPTALPGDGLQLIARPHSIVVSKEGYEPRTLSITPRPEFPLRLEVKLLKKGAVAKKRNVLETSLGQKLIRVAPGSFVMGSARSEAGRRRNETQYTVQLTRPFLISANEVTNAAFRQFAPAHSPAPYGGFALNGDLQPATRVSWEDAARFCNWLSERESLPPAYKDIGGEMVLIRPVGTGYRLPSEAEWAWAARFAGGKSRSVYPWGDMGEPLASSGNYADTSAAGIVPRALMTYNDGSPVTAPVGKNGSNALQLNDVGGNVAEWVHDRYAIPADRPAGAPVPDPFGPRNGEHHVIRGSSFKHASKTQLRLAYRDYGRDGREDVGFRIVRHER